jgi:hypothetical protein
MTDREYDKRKEQLDKYFDEFVQCIVKTFEEDPKYAFIAFESYSSTFLLASVPVDREASLIENLKTLKENNEEVFLNATNNMVKALNDPNYLDAEFTVHLDDEP